jgi:DNA-binding transcriptional MerR regulator
LGKFLNSFGNTEIMKRYTIQQAADKLRISAKTLRRWEARGIIHPDRTPGNQRRYT